MLTLYSKINLFVCLFVYLFVYLFVSQVHYFIEMHFIIYLITIMLFIKYLKNCECTIKCMKNF